MILFGRYFEVRHAIFSSSILTLEPGDLPPLNLIYLVSHEDHLDVLGRVLPYRRHPHLQVSECVPLRHIVDEEDGVRVLVEVVGERPEPFLARGVPQDDGNRRLGLRVHILGVHAVQTQGGQVLACETRS